MVTLTGDAEEPPYDDRHPRDAAVADRADEARPRALDPLLLGLEPDREARLVRERHQREVEGVAELDQSDRLLACGHVRGPPEVHGVVGQDAHGIAVDARESRDARAPVPRCDLEEGTAVDDVLDDLVAVVGSAAIARDEGQELLIAPARVVAGFDPRRHLPDVARQIREETANHLERLRLVLGQVVDHAALLRVDLLAAELFLGDVSIP
jgi:hypothetical protein